jgi:hypothetical protein
MEFAVEKRCHNPLAVTASPFSTYLIGACIRCRLPGRTVPGRPCGQKKPEIEYPGEFYRRPDGQQPNFSRWAIAAVKGTTGTQAGGRRLAAGGPLDGEIVRDRA